MRKLYSLLLLGMAACLLLWFAGCSNDQPTMSGSVTNETQSTGRPVALKAGDAVLTVSATECGGALQINQGCCLSPVVIFESVTDSSVILQICARSTGAAAGLAIQWMELPVDVLCGAFVFPAIGINMITLPTPLAPYECLRVEITGLACETPFIFRAFAVNEQGCGSAPSNRICATTLTCPEFLCPDMPGVLTCTGTPTSTTITLQVCAGASGASGGLELQMAPLASATMVCGNFVFDSLISPFIRFTDVAHQLAPNTCVDLTIPNLICETPYVFRVRATEGTGFNCPSVWTGNVCCTTAPCEQGGPCMATPVIDCIRSTDNTLTLSICAGTTGAHAGVWVQYFPLAAGMACADLTTWPTTGWLQVRPGPFTPNQCMDLTLNNLLPGRLYAIRAQALFCCPPLNCPSTWTAILCCETATDGGPGATCVQTMSWWRTHQASWPVTTLEIGSLTYTPSQLMIALNRSTTGNALAQLVKQLIAVELNLAAGTDETAIISAVVQANTLIGSLNITMGYVATNTPLGQQMLLLAAQLELYNQGLMGIPHCL